MMSRADSPVSNFFASINGGVSYEEALAGKIAKMSFIENAKVVKEDSDDFPEELPNIAEHHCRFRYRMRRLFEKQRRALSLTEEEQNEIREKGSFKPVAQPIIHAAGSLTVIDDLEDQNSGDHPDQHECIILIFNDSTTRMEIVKESTRGLIRTCYVYEGVYQRQQRIFTRAVLLQIFIEEHLVNLLIEFFSFDTYWLYFDKLDGSREEQRSNIYSTSQIEGYVELIIEKDHVIISDNHGIGKFGSSMKDLKITRWWCSQNPKNIVCFD